MIYLIVGLDRDTFARWHRNIQADDAATAESIARTRASREGMALEVAAAIGPSRASSRTSRPRPVRGRRFPGRS